MATLTGTTVVRDPATLRAVVLHAGDDLPEWAVGSVGEHLLAADPEPESKPAPRKRAAKKSTSDK